MAPRYGVCGDSMLEVAHLGLDAAQMTSQKGIRACFDAVTIKAAKVMHLKGYGIEAGCDARSLLLQARDAIAAIRLRANRLKVWPKGEPLAAAAEVVARLQVEGRASTVSFSNLYRRSSSLARLPGLVDSKNWELEFLA